MEKPDGKASAGWARFAAVGLVVGAVLGALSLVRGTANGTDDPVSGAVQYALTCARCHGERGEGVPPFKPLTLKSRSIEEILQRIREGVGAMPSFGYLSAVRQRAIAEHVQQLGDVK